MSSHRCFKNNIYLFAYGSVHVHAKHVAVRSPLTGVGSLLLHVRPEIELRLLALVAGAFTHEALVLG